jgi:hypothetical protein
VSVSAFDDYVQWRPEQGILEVNRFCLAILPEIGHPFGSKLHPIRLEALIELRRFIEQSIRDEEVAEQKRHDAALLALSDLAIRDR